LPRHLTFLLCSLLQAIALALPGTNAAAQHPGQDPAPAAPPAAQRPREVPQQGPEPQEQGPGERGEGPQDADSADEKPKEPRRGIPVDDALVHTHCARCHALDERKHMTRISYVRKSPEGWSETIKRMGRLHGLQLSPTDARQLVRSLANSHGLARSEAERGLYESERRVHWSEEQQEQDFRRACAQCHTLGRVLLQQRDDEEWQLLRATHVAMFPLARGQMGGGPPEDEPRRGPGRGRARGGEGAQGAQGARPGSESDSGAPPQREGGGPTQGVGDRVLQQLAKAQPLFTPAWEGWQKNRRDVPLAGTWTVTGHETGRGELVGTAEVRRVDADEYEVTWRLSFADGSRVERSGRGLLYAGYSWRGRSQDPGEGGASWREVLLLDDAWQSLRGRLFTGDYDEIGVDVTLLRDQGRPRVLGLGNRAVPVPVTGHRLEVHGEAFPANVGVADFFVGEGLQVTAVQRHSDRHVTLVVDAAAGTALGSRAVAFGADPGSADVQLYDTVDYVRIRPLRGLARVGGSKDTETGRMRPRQIERFEAFAVHRGADGKPFTEDDVDLFQVRPRWALEEFRVREDDDDVAHVGSIDPVSGVFTPAVDGPNPSRKWQANNVGDVFVTAEVELDVAVRPEPPKKQAGKADPGGARPDETAAAHPPQARPARETKTFRSRAHLLVTVPVYVKWNALEWEDR
jgi:quinohemoprotein amine dehydrogenase